MPRSSSAPRSPGPAGPRRAAALRAWLARIAAGAAQFEPAEAAGGAGPRHRFENRVRGCAPTPVPPTRASRAARDAALDAALAVLEAEWHAPRAASDGYAEALKAIRVYARDSGSARARRAGAGAAPARPGASGHRFPFEHETVG